MSLYSPQVDSWSQARRQHEECYMTIVTDQLPFIGRFQERRPWPSVGLRLSIAEMHRMYMRALQIELVKKGVALQFSNRAEDACKDLEPAITKYST